MQFQASISQEPCVSAFFVPCLHFPTIGHAMHNVAFFFLGATRFGFLVFAVISISSATEHNSTKTLTKVTPNNPRTVPSLRTLDT